MDARPTAVTWRGQTAHYTEDELRIMAELRAAGETGALGFVHAWKALDPDARLTDAEQPTRRLYVPADVAAFDERRNTSRVFPVTPDAIAAAEQARLEREQSSTPPPIPQQTRLLP